MAPGKQRPVRRRGTRQTDGTEAERLPYRIELWEGQVVGRVLALAGNANLARAIYNAAAAEYPGRVVVLSRGSRVITKSVPNQEP